jgi:hypothetical protein
MCSVAVGSCGDSVARGFSGITDPDAFCKQGVRYRVCQAHKHSTAVAAIS